MSYGKVFDNSGGSAFNAGINKDVTLSYFGLTQVSTPNYTGPVLDVTFSKGSSEVRQRVFPIDEAKVTPRMVKVKDASGQQIDKMQTQQEAIDAAYGALNSWVKHVVCSVATDEAFDKAMEKVDSFEGFINAATGLLGTEKPVGDLILGYGRTGYLEVPKYVWITGAFFSVKNKHQLKVSGRIKMTRPDTDGNSNPSSTQGSDVNWG